MAPLARTARAGEGTVRGAGVNERLMGCVLLVGAFGLVAIAAVWFGYMLGAGLTARGW